MTSLAATLILQAAFLTSASSASAMNYRDAYTAAQESNRPLLVVVGAEWCSACVDLKNRTIEDMQRSGKLDGVILSYVDVDKEPEIARQLLSSSSIPQVIVFAKGDTGWTRKQLVGRQSQETLSALIAPAVAVAKKAEPASK